MIDRITSVNRREAVRIQDRIECSCPTSQAQVIDATPGAKNITHSGRRGLIGGDIQGHDPGLPACFLDLASCLRQGVLVPAAQCHPGTAASQRDGSGPANAP